MRGLLAAFTFAWRGSLVALRDGPSSRIVRDRLSFLDATFIDAARRLDLAAYRRGVTPVELT